MQFYYYGIVIIIAERSAHTPVLSSGPRGHMTGQARLAITVVCFLLLLHPVLRQKYGQASLAEWMEGQGRDIPGESELLFKNTCLGRTDGIRPFRFAVDSLGASKREGEAGEGRAVGVFHTRSLLITGSPILMKTHVS